MSKFRQLKYKSYYLFSILLLSVFYLISGCNDTIEISAGRDLTHVSYQPVLYTPFIPDGLPALEQPFDNMLTVDGIALGRRIFFDPILSIDSTISCASCHKPELAFTDGVAISQGVNGTTDRSSMSLINIGFHHNGLFWDGRAHTLEEQALIPVEDPIEMGETWTNVVQKFQTHPTYPELFRKAFGIENSSQITKEQVAKALAQFQRSLISKGNSKFDKFIRGEIFLEDNEFNGYIMYFDLRPAELPDAECAHCHNQPLLMVEGFFNNGIQSSVDFMGFLDNGRGAVTNIISENGLFKAPSLRNIALTAPYMHDGRFNTLEEVVDHYSSGGQFSPNKSSLIYKLSMNASHKADLIAFLHTLTDTSDIHNPDFQSPF